MQNVYSRAVIMKTIFGALFSILLLSGASSAFAQQPTLPNVLGFQAWKTSRVDDAKANLDRIQLEKAANGRPDKKADAKEAATSRLQRATRSDQKLQQAQLNFEVAQELTVNDYFVLYLSQFKHRDAFVEAAKKLTPEEAADLMMSYQKHLAGSQDQDVIVPSSSLNATSLGKR